jgi:hypothetical protein
VLLKPFDKAEGLDIFTRNVHVGVLMQASLSSSEEKSHKHADEAKGWRRHEVDRKSVVSSHDRLQDTDSGKFLHAWEAIQRHATAGRAQRQDMKKAYRQSKSRSPLGKVIIVEGKLVAGN